MNPSILVDVGNTRVKWGRCGDGCLAAIASLPPDDFDAWQRQLADWGLSAGSAWVVSGVNPERRDRLIDWLRQRRQTVLVIDDPSQLPLSVPLENPRAVGIDRLLDAVAANSRRQTGAAVAIVDAGSAVTVDWVDSTGAFRGGAIVPGLRLMAQALHDYTALLPLAHFPTTVPAVPAPSTLGAMQAGIYWTVAAGVNALVARMSQGLPSPPQIWLTGGDASFLAHAIEGPAQLWPEMTLEGLRLAVEALP